MSGGVDSSVVAAMLHAEGASVIGVSMRLYATAQGDPGKSCCSPDDLLDAREVATASGFPFYVVNYQEEFQKRIVDYFVDEYRRGRTPSPCVLCNDHLKFDTLIDRMNELEADSLATGHYVRTAEREGYTALLRGVDRNKDQSYFLFGLRRELLPRLRFPLGGLTKAQVRELALELKVPTATKPESQDICFVADGSYANFVGERLDDAEIVAGRFVLAGSGRELGLHDGIHRFTVGQRRGLRVAWKEPLYVQSIDATTGDIVLAPAVELGVPSCVLERCNWLRWEQPPTEFECTAQIRYRHSGVPVRVRADENGGAVVTFVEPERAVTPGQACVLYDGDEVLGGGWIESTGAIGVK